MAKTNKKSLGSLPVENKMEGSKYWGRKYSCHNVQKPDRVEVLPIIKWNAKSEPDSLIFAGTSWKIQLLMYNRKFWVEVVFSVSWTQVEMIPCFLTFKNWLMAHTDWCWAICADIHPDFEFLHHVLWLT